MKRVALILVSSFGIAALVALLVGTAVSQNAETEQSPDVSYTLETVTEGGFAFVGVGGDIDGEVNPTLRAEPGDLVEVTLINADGVQHDFAVPAFDAQSDLVQEQGEEVVTRFRVDEDGTFEYLCTVPGHASAGMVGELVVADADAGEDAAAEAPGEEVSPAEYLPDVSYTLETAIADGRLVFVGDGGDIDGELNPTLRAEPGDVVQLTLINGDGAQHDVAIPDFDTGTDIVTEVGASTTTVFRVNEEGTFDYYCTVPGHRAAGMEGQFVVGAGDGAADESVSIVRDPTDLPPPLADDAPREHDLHLETVELEARVADGVSYRYWTFNGKVPGPFLRVRQNDTVNVTLANPEDSTMIHSVDFHAVTGPGGGAAVTQTRPGDETSFSFKALNPGLYVYHCATPMVAHHITNGMYGLILVEPEGGLSEVDREFYVMQGELYTGLEYGDKGAAELNLEKLLDEQPEYYTFNGAVGALTEEYPLQAEVGDDVRIFFGVGGPNKTSSFHVIGEVFDRVFDQASLTSPPLTNVQTTTVAPGGATMVEFGLDVPGNYTLVDHALSRAERGLVGILQASGEPNPEIFDGTPTGGGGH